AARSLRLRQRVEHRRFEVRAVLCAELVPERTLRRLDEGEQLARDERALAIEGGGRNLVPSTGRHKVVLDRVLERSLGVDRRHAVAASTTFVACSASMAITSSWPVTAAVMSAWRYSRSRANCCSTASLVRSSTRSALSSAIAI